MPGPGKTPIMSFRSTILSAMRYVAAGLLFNVLLFAFWILLGEIVPSVILAGGTTGTVAVVDWTLRKKKREWNQRRQDCERRLEERASELREQIRDADERTVLSRKRHDAAERALATGNYDTAAAHLRRGDEALREAVFRRVNEQLDATDSPLESELAAAAEAATDHNFEAGHGHLEAAHAAAEELVEETLAAAERAIDRGEDAEQRGDWEKAQEMYDAAITDLERASAARAGLPRQRHSGRIADRLEFARERRDLADYNAEIDPIQATIDEADSLRESASYDAAIREYEQAMEMIEELDETDPPPEADIDVTELRERIDDGLQTTRDRQALERRRAELEAVIETVDEADELRESGSFGQAIRTYEHAQDRLDDLDDSSEPTVEEIDVAELRDRMQRGLTTCRRRRIEADVDSAHRTLADGNPAEARDTFAELQDRIDEFERDTDDSLPELRERVAEGSLRARVELADKRIETASKDLSDDPYDAKSTFEEIRDDLDSFLDEAAAHDATPLQAEISRLIGRCEDGADSALRAMRGEQPEPKPADPARTRTVPTGGFSVDDSEAGGGTLPEHERMELLGSGGNADVYKICREADGEIAALKVPRWQGTLSADVVERFAREADTWARLDDHEHIVSVRASGTDPYPWIELEYLEGGNLEERIDNIGLEETEVIVSGLCDAVRYAHRHGVVHTDLKPANVLFTAGGTPKIGDWGLARVLLDHSLSIEGMTPTYAAPEQLDPETYGDPDDFTDLYQLGVVTYELLTGQPPFKGDTPAATTRAILTETPDPPSAVADVPSALDEPILRALEPAKEDRQEAVLYFRDAVHEALV